MGATRNWFTFVKKKLIKTTHRNIRTIHSSSLSDKSSSKEAAREERANLVSSSTPTGPTQSRKRKEAIEDVAATIIQAVFRGHLARRAYRALKSLVKMQALVRGALVRKQSQIALHCMQALVRLQVRLRAQQLLSRCGSN